MRLHNLKPRPGAKHRRRRVGKGESSGLGKTSGRGNKGQKSRSGSSIRPGFEGGQMPLARRLPRYGFNNKRFATRYAIINVSTLEDFFEAGDTVDEASLREKGLVKGHTHAGVKILAYGELSKKLSVIADKASATAREKVEGAGGSISEPVPAPAVEESEAEAEKPAPKKKAKSKAAPKAKKEEAPAEPEVEAEADEPDATASAEEE
jgi:large subunit ribosomal protein L15